MVKMIFGKLALSATFVGLLFLCACATQQTVTSTITNSIVVTPTGTVNVGHGYPITQEQAIAIAGSYVPAEVTTKATITLAFGSGNGAAASGIWTVLFGFPIAEITNGELGWQPDSKTHFSDGPYGQIQIDINATTGELILRSAGPLYTLKYS